MDSLWPDDLEQQAESITTPVSILKQQAALLGKQTKHKVEAKVEYIPPIAGFKSAYFRYNFYLVGPLIGGYRYNLFHIEHGIDLYPLQVFLDIDIAVELGTEEGNIDITVDDEQELIELLKDIFNSSKTRKIVTAVLSQSQ